MVDLEALDGIGDTDGVEFDGDGADDGHRGSTGGFMHAVMKIIGASDASLIFVISLCSVFLWVFNVGLNHYFNPGFESGRATLILIPTVIGAFVVPLRPVMNLIRTSEKPAQIIGASGVVRSSSLDSEFGEVEIERRFGRNLLMGGAGENDPVSRVVGTLAEAAAENAKPATLADDTVAKMEKIIADLRAVPVNVEIKVLPVRVDGKVEKGNQARKCLPGRSSLSSNYRESF